MFTRHVTNSSYNMFSKKGVVGPEELKIILSHDSLRCHTNRKGINILLVKKTNDFNNN